MNRTIEEDPLDHTTYLSGGYCKIINGDVLNKRYTILNYIDSGTFSTVWLAKDTEMNNYVAIKVNNSNRDDTFSAHYEINFLQIINNHKNYLELYDYFIYRNPVRPNESHVCIVMEIALCTLHDSYRYFNRRNNIMRLGIFNTIKNQMLVGLSYLHNECEIIHNDIKPENILVGMNQSQKTQFNKMLDDILDNSTLYNRIKKAIDQFRIITLKSIVKDPTNLLIKISDLGSACFLNKEKECRPSIIHTLPYRCPEVILGIDKQKYDDKADVWSLGCTLFELLTTNILFDKSKTDLLSDEEEMIAQMFELLNIDSITFPDDLIDVYKDIIHDKKLRNVIDFQPKSLLECMTSYYNIPLPLATSISDQLLKMLQFNPMDRMSMSDLLTYIPKKDLYHSI